jgi:hypothetical protein
LSLREGTVDKWKVKYLLDAASVGSLTLSAESLQVFHGLIIVTLGVGRLTLERQRVEGVLRVLLVEDVALAVIPVRESSCVGAGLLHWLGRGGDLFMFWHSFYCLLLGESDLVRRRQFHFMRVNDLGFLLKVEGVFVMLHASIL